MSKQKMCSKCGEQEVYHWGKCKECWEDSQKDKVIPCKTCEDPIVFGPKSRNLECPKCRNARYGKKQAVVSSVQSTVFKKHCYKCQKEQLFRDGTCTHCAYLAQAKCIDCNNEGIIARGRCRKCLDNFLFPETKLPAWYFDKK